MTAIQTFQNSSFKVQCFCVDGARGSKASILQQFWDTPTHGKQS